MQFSAWHWARNTITGCRYLPQAQGPPVREHNTAGVRVLPKKKQSAALVVDACRLIHTGGSKSWTTGIPEDRRLFPQQVRGLREEKV